VCWLEVIDPKGENAKPKGQVSLEELPYVLEDFPVDFRDSYQPAPKRIRKR
jgi:hypothetical protein